MRAGVAIVAAYALAMQMLLGAVLVSQAANADPFTICLSTDEGAPADHGGTGKSSPHDHCVLCTFAKDAHAVLGADISVAPYPEFSLVRGARTIERVVPFRSPTGQYQRGPPAGVTA